MTTVRRLLGAYTGAVGEEERHFPRAVRWFALSILAYFLVYDLFLVQDLAEVDGTTTAWAVRAGVAAGWAAFAGVIVIQRPRLSHLTLVPLLVLMATDAWGYGQTVYVIILAGIAAYSAPASVFLICLGSLLVWEVAWSATIAGGGWSDLPTYLVLTLLLLAPGRALRRVTRQRAVADRALADVRAEERKAVARELHDVVAHELTVIAMQSRAAELTADPVTRDDALRAGPGSAPVRVRAHRSA